MDLFKAAPEQLAKYVDFMVGFTRSPRQALDPFVPKDSTIAQSVSPQLLLYVALSVGLAIVLNAIGTAVGMAPDSSRIVTIGGRLDEKALPFAAVALVVIVAVVWHGLAKLIAWLLARTSPTSGFRGEVAGSINASLAFAAWALPLFMTVIIVIRTALRDTGFPVLFLLIAVIPMSLLFPVTWF